MSAAIVTLSRVFRFAGRDLPDPNPEMDVKDVLSHYVRQFPRLLGAKVVDPIQESDTYVYEFREANFGSRG